MTSSVSGNAQTISNSSERLAKFLADTRLHKKDFAEMIGVTLSYVYSLIDSKISFPTRATTIERIAVVMDIPPETFAEYAKPEEPKLIDPGVVFFQDRQKELKLTTIQLLKKFPRNKRVEIVDLWRGAKPLPLDWAYLYSIASALGLRAGDAYPYWQNRLHKYLINGGMEPMANLGLLNSFFQGAKDYLKV